MEAMGIKVPSKAVNIDTAIFRGKELAISLDDEEYDEKIYSRVVDAFLLSELDADDIETDADDEDTEEVDEDVEDTDTATTDDDDLEDLDLDI
jgi:hypothetical protein